MERLRNYLLKNNEIELYRMILDFMRKPEDISIDDIMEITPDEIKRDVSELATSLMEQYAHSINEYRKKYVYGQVLVWEAIISAYEELVERSDVIESIELSKDYDNYQKSVNELKRVLTLYSDMQDTLSELEDVLGVDRFLDRISEGTFDILEDIVKKSKIIIERKTLDYKEMFQDKWNSTNVYNVLAHSLVRRNDDNQVCDQFISNCDQAILLLIDGFGFCQYLWNLNIGSHIENYTFNENIFKWLSDNHLSKEYILGSSFITDTGAGLAQIYLGKESRETGIFASKIKDRCEADPFFETKRVAKNTFDRHFRYPNSITDVLTVLGDDATVYYCSKYRQPPSGFSLAIFKSAEVTQVLPPERVFSVLMDDIANNHNTGLQVVYLTGIDNSGHTMGAYSQFERLEHRKIDSLIRSFIIELAYNFPDAFNGKRKIMVTADHGMYESSRIIINRNDIIDYLDESGIKGVRIVENNRALLLYNKGIAADAEIKAALKSFFYDRNLLVDISDSDDESFYKLIGNSSFDDIKPDIVVRFIGDGLFYSNPYANEHLLHLGGHGGFSVDEVFIPLLEIPLTIELHDKIRDRFLSKK